MQKPPPADPRWAWFFDIDGTLVELAATPSSVVVHDDLPHLISRLRDLSDGAVSLITGRAISDVDRILPLDGVSVAGQHGFEMRSSSGRVDRAHASINVERIAEELAHVIAKHPGLIAELKGSSVALHYRRVPKLAGFAHRVMRRLHSQHGEGLEIQRGKLVVELRPSGSDKGRAITELMRRAPFIGRRPVFVGDDVTDEAGFEIVNELGGISVKVGRGATRAHYRLKNVEDVRQWLADAIRKMNHESRRNGTA